MYRRDGPDDAREMTDTTPLEASRIHVLHLHRYGSSPVYAEMSRSISLTILRPNAHEARRLIVHKPNQVESFFRAATSLAAHLIRDGSVRACLHCVGKRRRDAAAQYLALRSLPVHAHNLIVRAREIGDTEFYSSHTKHESHIYIDIDIDSVSTSLLLVIRIYLVTMHDMAHS